MACTMSALIRRPAALYHRRWVALFLIWMRPSLGTSCPVIRQTPLPPVFSPQGEADAGDDQALPAGLRAHLAESQTGGGVLLDPAAFVVRCNFPPGWADERCSYPAVPSRLRQIISSMACCNSLPGGRWK